MNNLKYLIINKKDTILKALKFINKNTLGTCFVVDDKSILKGVLTDGDIRRALLKKISLKTDVYKISNKKYKYLHENYSQTEQNKLLKKKTIKPRCIPIIDKNKKVIDFILSTKKISLAKPNLRGNEVKYLNECINTGWISSTGKFVKEFEKKFSLYTKIKHCIAVSNGTTALQLALHTLGINENNEVIVPNLTFASPVNAVIHSGAKPVFVDVKENTYCIDEDLIQKKITKKTKAIIVVHLYGHPANISKIKKIANKNKIFLIEDCAEALGSFYKNKHVGNFGDISTFSFFGNKMITTGEGGMVGFKSQKLKTKAEILRDHGMSKKIKYWHEDIGFNFRITNIQSAIGCAQMERIHWFVKKKLNLVKLYNKKLSVFNFLKLPGEYGPVKNSYWLYTVRLNDQLTCYKNQILKKLNVNGIEARPIFFPMHTMKPYKKYISKGEIFPISNKLFKSSISLPSAHDVNTQDVTRIFNFLSRYKN